MLRTTRSIELKFDTQVQNSDPSLIVAIFFKLYVVVQIYGIFNVLKEEESVGGGPTLHPLYTRITLHKNSTPNDSTRGQSYLV